MSNDVKIDRVVLDIQGVSEAGARRIALMVAEGLGASGGLPQAVAAPKLSVAIPWDAARDEGSLARLIVAATLRDLARTS
jgi:hypothetical protein